MLALFNAFENSSAKSLPALSPARGLTKWMRARSAKTALVYGAGEKGAAVMEALALDASAPAVAGVFDDRTGQRTEAENTTTPPIGGLAALKNYVRTNQVDMVIMSLPPTASGRISGLVSALSDLPVEVRLATTGAAGEQSKLQLIKLAARPISGRAAVAKRIFDFVGAAMALTLLAPVMALVAVAVRLESKGPALFRQKRYGFNNELIEVYKFRSMYTDRTDATASKLVTKNDPRVTRVGRIIRKSSLDELPQLFNVLVGTLSLVGPRPHAVQAKAAGQLYPDVVDRYFARHNVKPGITGWAQINGWRGETDTVEKIQQRVACDLDYIKNWSLWLDVKILAKTPRSLLKTENAY